MWNAQTLVQSAVHPDTGEIIPKPFRMSGYVPFNLPVSSSQNSLFFNLHPFRFSSDCWCLKELLLPRFGNGQIKRTMLLSTTQTETRKYDLPLCKRLHGLISDSRDDFPASLRLLNRRWNCSFSFFRLRSVFEEEHG